MRVRHNCLRATWLALGLSAACLAQSGQSGPDGEIYGATNEAVAAGGNDLAPAPAEPNAPAQAVNANKPAADRPVSGGNVLPTEPVTDPNAPDILPGQFVDSRYPYALVGRFDLSIPERPVFSLPGSKIGVRFTGTSLSGSFASTMPDTFDVVIDGNEYVAPSDAFAIPNTKLLPCQPRAAQTIDANTFPGCLLLNQSANVALPTSYPIVTGLAPGVHTAWLVKRTEFRDNFGGTVQLFGFGVDANAAILSPPPQARRRIEVVGDSSTAGYGAAQRGPCTQTARSCDGNRSVAAYLGQYLHAEAVNISSSGSGVYMSVFDQTADHNLPVCYRRVTPFAAKAYDFSQDHVDVVVLSAGGDDLWGNYGSGFFNNNNPAIATPARTMFVNAYTAWLAEIRQKRPDASIVCTLTYAATGNDVVTLGSAVQEAVAARTAAGDANVVYFNFFPANDPVVNPNKFGNLFDAASAQKATFGCDGHVQPKLAQYLAGVLGPTIAKKMGWTDVGF